MNNSIHDYTASFNPLVQQIQQAQQKAFASKLSPVLRVLALSQNLVIFLRVISKAKTACEHCELVIRDHFAGVGKMVELGSRSQSLAKDVKKVERGFATTDKKNLKKPDGLDE